MRIALEHLTKKFGSVVGVDDISLDIEDGEFVAFLGPSGCGKTTTLLMIAGIYRPTAGIIRFGDRIRTRWRPKTATWDGLPGYALYPHMTVFGNIAYPLGCKGPEAGANRAVQAVADKMGIGDLLDRRRGSFPAASNNVRAGARAG